MIVGRGYSAGRTAYDARRRRHPLDAHGQLFKDVVQRDPCAYCGAPPGPDMAADHIVSLRDGGDNVWENLTAACRPCNASKRDRKLLGWMLDRLEPACR